MSLRVAGINNNVILDPQLRELRDLRVALKEDITVWPMRDVHLFVCM